MSFATDVISVHAGRGLRPCPLCGSLEFTPVLPPIQRCRDCGLSLVNPLGKFTGENESEDYFLKKYLPFHLAKLENSLAERRAHIAAIQKHFVLPPHPRHLDVGCALGYMMMEASVAGWETAGVETSPFAARYAAEHTGRPVHAGTLEEAAFPAHSFDVVTLMDVIEHTSEPLELASEIYRVLRPRGVLFIITPNFGSIFVRLYGRKAYGIWPDQHVVYFQPSTISKLVLKAGFRKALGGSKDFYSENLRRLLPRKKGEMAQIRSAFAPQTSLGKARALVNSILMHVPIGDKLIAFAQK
jgi:2-polyprenyl-3-methyl-5-hydroxy-6-metoxy-1,4-benzoquinol methylase